MDSLKINSIFPTLYVKRMWEEYDQHKKTITDFCYKYEKAHPVNANASLPNQEYFEGLHNYYSSFLIGHTENLFEYQEITPLKDFIAETVRELNSQMQFTAPHDWDLTHSWININRKYSMHRAHDHGSSIWSGCFYVKTHSESAPIIFTNSLGTYRQHWPDRSVRGESNEFIKSQQIVNPAEGELIIFPSYLVHSVPQELTDQDRICISFNID